jgi:hypothetical protein
MAVNPAFLLAGGIIGAGAIIYNEYSDMKEGTDARYKQMETDALRKDVGSGKVKIDDLRQRGMTDDQIRELISGRKLLPGESFEGFDTGVKLKIGGAGKPDPEALNLAIGIQKRQRENDLYFKDQAIAAGGRRAGGYPTRRACHNEPPAWRGRQRDREQPARRRGRVHERDAVERRLARIDQPPVESGTAYGVARSTRRAAAYPRVRSGRSGGPAWLHLTLDERG